MQKVELTNGSDVISINGITVKSSTELKGLLNINTSSGDGKLALGDYDVVVSQLNNGTVNKITGSKLFTIIAPVKKILSVTPNTGKQNQYLSVAIVGENTNIAAFIQGATPTSYVENISFSNGSKFWASNFKVKSPTLINANVQIPPGATPGVYDVTVGLNGQIKESITGAKLFSVTAASNTPGIISISPDNAVKPQKLNVTITGENVNFKQKVTMYTVYYAVIDVSLQRGSVNIQSNSYYPATETTINATFDIPDGVPDGKYDVLVSQLNTNYVVDFYSGTQLFTVSSNSPQSNLISVDTNASKRGNSLTLKITGQNVDFTEIASGSTPTTYIKGINLIKGNYVINAQKKSVPSKTEILADLIIPVDAPIGYYNAQVIQWYQSGSGYYYTGENLFAVTPDLSVVGLKPDISQPGGIVQVNVNDLYNDIKNKTLTNVYLQTSLLKGLANKGQSGSNLIVPIPGGEKSMDKLLSEQVKIVASSWSKTGNRSLTAKFNIPANATEGRYDFVAELNHNELTELPGLFTVKSLESAGEVSNKVSNYIDNIVVSPNPAKTYLSFDFVTKEDGDITLLIINPLGMVIEMTDAGFTLAGANSFYLNTTKYNSGSYFYMITLNNHSTAGKVQIIK